MPAKPPTVADTAADTALLLTGGGARAAYQVGVLQTLAALRREAYAQAGQSPPLGSPFGILTGTSAGAINAAALASRNDAFDEAVAQLVHVWRHFAAGQVYGADALSVASSGARWLTLLSLGWALAKWRRLQPSVRPRSLLDNRPLAALLRQMVPLERVPDLVAQGHLRALAVTASSFSSGQHVTFFEGHADLQAWQRSQRYAVRDRISHAHLLASSAIPFVFPAQALPMTGGAQYFGDGSMRQTAPMAAAIHLGAQRLLVVGAGRLHEPAPDAAHAYPSLAQIAGHAMSNIFLDALAVDVERAQRINATLSLIRPELRAHSHLRPISLLVIAPSERLDAMAARHISALPTPVRAMLGGLGVSSQRVNDARGAALASYLLFEAPYTQELMALGERDTRAQADEVRRFFGWPLPALADDIPSAGPGAATPANA
jgi:NTE family protein